MSDGEISKEVKGIKPPKLRSLSRSEAKKVRALHTAEINRLTDGKQRALEDTAAELQLTRRKLVNACAVLEAVVRRHGEQVFDRKVIESECSHGRVQFDVTPDRIKLRLADELRLVDSD